MPQTIEVTNDEATTNLLALDINFFIEQTRSEEDTHTQRRYARTAILLTAFWLESMSKRIADCLQNPKQDWDKNDFNKLNGQFLPKPVARFRAVYKHFLNADLSTDLDKVRDIFKIRNKALAHPEGRSVQHTKADATVEGSFKYMSKSKDFPKLGSQLTPANVEEIVKDAVDFVDRFQGDVGTQIESDNPEVSADIKRAVATLKSNI